MEIINLTSKDFIAKVGDFASDPKGWKYIGDKPCIVDFYAPWCRYCKNLEPLLVEMSKLYDGQLYIYKVDVDQEADLEAAFNIRTIPTLLLCPTNKPWSLTLGVLTKQQLKELIDTQVM